MPGRTSRTCRAGPSPSLCLQNSAQGKAAKAPALQAQPPARPRSRPAPALSLALMESSFFSASVLRPPGERDSGSLWYCEHRRLKHEGSAPVICLEEELPLREVLCKSEHTGGPRESWGWRCPGCPVLGKRPSAVLVGVDHSAQPSFVQCPPISTNTGTGWTGGPAQRLRVRSDSWPRNLQARH